ncbi:DMT family transporter [Tumebacillus flagellatus]|uniref:DMT family transporter n=1 Tax=Tumebacillus flagellatus TaxID=1157490 RepID=UPI001376D2C7|nr:DMT family transporter [Tumebacillus flagellatus]
MNPISVEHRAGSRLGSWLLGMLAITLVTAIWGYSNVVIRQAETTIAPSVLMWLRFGFAGLFLLPVLFRNRLSIRIWMTGLGTGALFGVAVLSQGSAMLTVPVSEVAFITALYVVFTPLGMSILQRKLPSKLTWLAVTISLIGATLMIGTLTVDLHVGILWSLVAAVAATGQIMGTTSLSNTVPAVQLAALQSAGAGITMTVAVVLQGAFHPAIYTGLFHWSITEWVWIAYLVLPATVLAIFLQSWGQAKITATEAALVFNLEPVWTAIFAWTILSEGMTLVQGVGALLILSSLTLVSKPTAGKNESHNR